MGGLWSASPLGLPADDPGNEKASPDGVVFDELCAGAGSNRLGRMQLAYPLSAVPQLGQNLIRVLTEQRRAGDINLETAVDRYTPLAGSRDC